MENKNEIYKVIRKVKPFSKGEFLKLNGNILTSVSRPEISISFDVAEKLGISLKRVVEVDGIGGKYKNTSDLFIEMRRHLELTQVDLSEFLGISRTSIVNIESGIQVPSLKTLQKIANDLGYKLFILLEKN